jgi:hypothetical protein
MVGSVRHVRSKLRQTVGEFCTDVEPMGAAVARLCDGAYIHSTGVLHNASASPQPGDAVPSQWDLKRKKWMAPQLRDGTVVPGAWLVPRDTAYD